MQRRGKSFVLIHLSRRIELDEPRSGGGACALVSAEILSGNSPNEIDIAIVGTHEVDINAS